MMPYIIGSISALVIIVTLVTHSEDYQEKERLDSIFQQAANEQTGFCFGYKGNPYCMKYIKTKEEFTDCISGAECFPKTRIKRTAE